MCAFWCFLPPFLVPLYIFAYLYTFIFFLFPFLPSFIPFLFLVLPLNFWKFVACSVLFSRFLFNHIFSSSQLSVSIFFLRYLLPSFHFLFVYFLVSFVISTETITSQILVPHCLLRFAQTFSCCVLTSLVPDFMVFDQEFVEVQLHNLLRRQSNFSEALYSL
jgi:hypothetical protein